MAEKRTEEFKWDAVRIALTSGLPRRQVAADLGVGLSTVNKWIKAHGDAGTVPQKEAELVKEIERLRRELRLVTEGKEEQQSCQRQVCLTNETLKKATAIFAGQKR